MRAAGAAAAARDGGGVGGPGAAGAAARLRPPVHVLPRARVPAVRRRAQGGVRVPAVRHARVPQAALLPPAPGRRGRAGTPRHEPPVTHFNCAVFIDYFHKLAFHLDLQKNYVTLHDI